MVIDDHTSTRVNFFSNIFPYNSFYMPLFVFVSGYFFRKKDVWGACVHKVKKLLVPYIVCNFCFDFIALIIDLLIGTKWYVPISLKSIFIMLCPGYTISTLNGPAWFLYMLFLVSVIYVFLRCIFPMTMKNDILLSLILWIVGLVSVEMAIKGFTIMGGIKGSVFILGTKIGFFLQFYHLGYMFNKYFESFVLKFRKIFVCIVCIAANVILILIYGDKINFYGTNTMANFNYLFLPLITSITGILFYYMLMRFLAEKIGKIGIVEFISRNTMTIMEVHMLFLNIPNIFAYLMCLRGNLGYSDFDINAFLSGAGFRYNDNVRLVAFFCGLLGSVIVVFFLEKIKKVIIEKSFFILKKR